MCQTHFKFRKGSVVVIYDNIRDCRELLELALTADIEGQIRKELEAGPYTFSDLARKVNISADETKGILEAMAEAGFVDIREEMACLSSQMTS